MLRKREKIKDNCGGTLNVIEALTMSEAWTYHCPECENMIWPLLLDFYVNMKQ